MTPASQRRTERGPPPEPERLGLSQDEVRRLLEAGGSLLSREGAALAVCGTALDELGARLQEGRFHLAILGQFKRGKSAFINALLGEPLLPTAIVPLTALPTFVRSGSLREAAVHFEDERPAATLRADSAQEIASFIGRYVAEPSNPRNREGVERVEVRHPSPLLLHGVVLIDTPGVGSTFRHNTEATLNFLPQCDAAVLIVSADPPITEVELAFLKQVKSKVQRIVFVLNKTDLLSDEERSIALDFLRRTISESAGLGTPPTLFPVSSRRALEARRANDARLWKRSGMEAVEQHLLAFLATEKTAALNAAIARKASAVLADAGLQVRLSVQSLEMPLADLENRLARFDEKIAEAEQQRISASDLLAGARNRMVNVLEEQAEALRKKYRKALRETVQRALGSTEVPDEETARAALAEAIPTFFEHELGDMSRSFNRRVAEALKPHEERASDIMDDVRRYAAQLFDIPYRRPESEAAYITVREPYWVTHKWSSSLTPIPEGFFDRLLPATWRYKRMRKRLDAKIEDLVVSNVENLRWSTLQNLDTSFRRFASDLDERLRLTVDATRGAIQAAMEKRRTHADSIAEDVARLRALLADMERIGSVLSDLSAGEQAAGGPENGG
ncbi:MAG: dynamin family protein [Kiritimatiellae bacterium]|nr:dynamin family protein [Kiritimatiellia bacterium]